MGRRKWLLVVTLYWTRSCWCGGPLGQSCGMIPTNSTPMSDSDDREPTQENFVLGPPLIACVSVSAALLCSSVNLSVSVHTSYTDNEENPGLCGCEVLSAVPGGKCLVKVCFCFCYCHDYYHNVCRNKKTTFIIIGSQITVFSNFFFFWSVC